MLEYMKAQGGRFAEAAAVFAAATGLEDFSGNEGAKGLLEKKWTSVVRLQRKVRWPVLFFIALVFYCGY